MNDTDFVSTTRRAADTNVNFFAFRALQGIENLPCPALPWPSRAGYDSSRAGQGQVTKIFTGQGAGWECHNLLTCDKFCTLGIVDIYSRVRQKEKNRNKSITK
jgi:hypothetical protein